MKTFVLRFLMYLAGLSALTALVFLDNVTRRHRPELLRHLTADNFPDIAPIVVAVVAGCAFVVAGAHGLLDGRDKKARP